jgi:hypothetical protein
MAPMIHGSVRIAKAFETVQNSIRSQSTSRKRTSASVIDSIPGGVGERLKPPVLKTGVHLVHREFESRPLRQGLPMGVSERLVRLELDQFGSALL